MPRRGTFWSGVAANRIDACSPKAATLSRHHWKRCLDTCGSGAPTNAYFCGRSAGAYRSGGMNAAFERRGGKLGVPNDRTAGDR